MIYLQLYFEFIKVGLFSVGGGLATLPFLYDISERTGWFTHADVANMIAVAESTPGPIGINMATFAGYMTGGIPGGIITTLGLITPAVIIITIIAKILNHFLGNRYVEAVFTGLRPASIALIASAGISVMKVALMDIQGWKTSGKLSDLFIWPAMVLAAAIFAGQKKWPKIHPTVWILIAAVIGIVFRFAE